MNKFAMLGVVCAVVACGDEGFSHVDDCAVGLIPTGVDVGTDATDVGMDAGVVAVDVGVDVGVVAVDVKTEDREAPVVGRAWTARDMEVISPSPPDRPFGPRGTACWERQRPDAWAVLIRVTNKGESKALRPVQISLMQPDCNAQDEVQTENEWFTVSEDGCTGRYLEPGELCHAYVRAKTKEFTKYPVLISWTHKNYEGYQYCVLSAWSCL